MIFLRLSKNEIICEEDFPDEMNLLYEEVFDKSSKLYIMLLNPNVGSYDVLVEIDKKLDENIELCLFKNERAFELSEAMDSLAAGISGFDTYRVCEYEGGLKYSIVEFEVSRDIKRFVTSNENRYLTNKPINFSTISKYFLDSDHVILPAFSALSKRYNVFNGFLYQALISSDIYSKNDLLVSYKLSDVERCIFKEIPLLRRKLQRHSVDVKPFAKSLSDCIDKINHKMSLIELFSLDDDSDYMANIDKIMISYLWMSSFYYSASFSYIEGKCPSLAYLYSFRMLETFVDSFLLHSQEMEISEFGSAKQFSINNESIKGFGQKWYLFKNKIKLQYGISVDHKSTLNIYVKYRNDLSEIHGVGKVNSNMAKQFIAECEKLMLQVEDKVWFRDKYWSSFNAHLSGVFSNNASKMFFDDLFSVLGYSILSEA